MPTKKRKASKRSKGPKCVICGKPAVISMFWRTDGFSIVPIRVKRHRPRKASGR